jgi:Protein of unknown function (DUF1566)
VNFCGYKRPDAGVYAGQLINKKEEDFIMRYVKRIMVLFVMLFFIPMAALAGDISGGVSPTTAGGGAMNTLEDIYNLINLGTTNVPRTGTFTEPTAGPVATGHTLTQVYDRAKTSSRPARTGQILCYNAGGTVIDCPGTGQDGAAQKGVTWPSPRFTNNNNGTVTDNLTGLIWLKVADYNSTTSTTGGAIWTVALTFCNTLESGQCGLTDGSRAGDWRLPNLFELESLLDLAYSYPALSNDAGTGMWVNGAAGSSFTDVQSDEYWSSTTRAKKTDHAWHVGLYEGDAYHISKTARAYYVWPVRGGQ